MTLYIILGLGLCLLIGLARAYASETSIVSHWSQLIDGMEYSSREFYAALKVNLEARRMPGISMSEVEISEGAALVSAKRLYLRLKRGDVHFDICAAPYGRGFFFSSWLVAPPSVLRLSPVIGWVIALFSQPTYFRMDTAGMFRAAAHAAVMETIDGITSAKGIRALSESERKPMMRGFGA